MFTGLIESVATVGDIRQTPSGRALTIAWAGAGDLRPGESIAVNGVCLTATACDPGGFSVDISAETLRVTTLGGLAPGRRVNLERAMRADGRFGGHVVQGHVDGVGTIAGITRDGDGAWLDVDVPEPLTALMIPRGSVTLDGVSLTIATISVARIGVQIVPFTLSHTSLDAARAGDPVNVEADVIGKYVARLLEHRRDDQESVSRWS
jgi:riboflavin synthase